MNKLLIFFDRNNVDCLAWASVQINCQCSVSDTRINLPYTRKLSSEEISPSSSDTSFVPNRGIFLLEIKKQLYTQSGVINLTKRKPDLH